MTDEAVSDPFGEMLTELRALRDTVERGITSTTKASSDVDDMRRDIARIEAKSDRRARTFRRLWVTIAVVVVAGAVAIGIGYHLENQQRGCFRDWAKASASRTEKLTKAADLRIRKLNDVLAIRARGGSDIEVQQASVEASAAGEAYETLVHANPPIPAGAVTCQSPIPETS